MRRLAARLLCVTAVLGGSASTADEAARTARTLLIPRAAEGTLEFVDPGSGLRVASVPLDTGPQRVTVAPDGTQAAVLGCGPAPAAEGSKVRLSIVDLEQPRETRRIELHINMCPLSLTWFDADHVALAVEPPASHRILDLSTGKLEGGPLTAETRTAIARAVRAAVVPDSSTVAVRQSLDSGTRLQDLATAPVIPRAVCHACTPTP